MKFSSQRATSRINISAFGSSVNRASAGLAFRRLAWQAAMIPTYACKLLSITCYGQEVPNPAATARVMTGRRQAMSGALLTAMKGHASDKHRLFRY